LGRGVLKQAEGMEGLGNRGDMFSLVACIFCVVKVYMFANLLVFDDITEFL
jgi:hypothetical protein